MITKIRSARLFFFVTAILLAASLSSWIASYFVAFSVTIGTPWHVATTTCDRGQWITEYDLDVNRFRSSIGYGDWELSLRKSTFDAGRYDLIYFPPIRFFPKIWGSTNVRVTTFQLYLPSFILALAAIAQYRFLLRARAKPGFCPTCGYDLRATPNRCPECGFIPVKASAVGGDA